MFHYIKLISSNFFCTNQYPSLFCPHQLHRNKFNFSNSLTPSPSTQFSTCGYWLTPITSQSVWIRGNCHSSLGNISNFPVAHRGCRQTIYVSSIKLLAGVPINSPLIRRLDRQHWALDWVFRWWLARWSLWGGWAQFGTSQSEWHVSISSRRVVSHVIMIKNAQFIYHISFSPLSFQGIARVQVYEFINSHR